MALTQIEPYMTNTSASFTLGGANIGSITNLDVGGGGGNGMTASAGAGALAGAGGAVRIIWGFNRLFPTTNTSDL